MEFASSISVYRENISTDPAPPRVTQMISNEVLDIYLIYFNIITAVITSVGIIDNTLNIIVFYRMGLSSTSNISFFALAFGDLFCVVYTISTSVIHHPFIDDAVWGIDLESVMILLYPLFLGAAAFGSFVTAIISVERSCCIAIPLKVKTIFTRKTLTCMFIAVAVYQLSMTLPVLLTRKMGGFTALMEYSRFLESTFNSSRVVYAFYKSNVRLTIIFGFLSFAVPNNICFIIIIVANIFLVIKFRESKRVRDGMTAGKVDKSEAREARIVTTVVAVCVIYVIGFFPTVAVYAAGMAVPTLNNTDPYWGNFMWVLFSLCALVQSISNSANFFIYLKMNTKFRKEFLSLFRGTGKQVPSLKQV